MSTKARLISLVLISLMSLLMAGSVRADGGDNVSTASPLQPGVTVYGDGNYDGSSPDRRRFWYINLNAGDHLAIQYAWTGGGGPDNLTMCLLDPSIPDSDRIKGSDCSVIDQVSQGHSHSVNYMPKTAGRWVIELWDCVDFCNGQRWTYQLTVYVSSAAQKPPPPKAVPKVVVAGDSFASGDGTQKWPALGRSCHRTGNGWPSQLPYQVANIACAGAKLSALFHPFRGEAPQIVQMKQFNPTAVVLMIGGNDALYSAALRNCFDPRQDCTRADQYGNTKLTQNGKAITALLVPLARALAQIGRDLPQAQVILLGYPQVFPPSPREIVNCGGLKDDERDGLNGLGDSLEAIQRQAVTVANAAIGGNRIHFVSTKYALGGHELCYFNSWMFKVNYPACLVDARCAHPTAAGQAAIAERARAALKKFVG